MPVKMLNFLQNKPPTSRHGRSCIIDTEEYQDIITALGAGLRPHEYITANFPDGHPVYKYSRHPLVLFLLQVKKKIKELHLPYDAYIVKDVLYVVGRSANHA